MSLQELEPVRGPGWWRRGTSPKLRQVQLVDPRPEDFQQLGDMLSLDRGLLKQLQDLNLSPGLVSYPSCLLARLNVPSLEPDAPLQWRRVDVLLGGSFVVTASPSSVEVVHSARERFAHRKGPLRGDTLLALLVSEVVLAFQHAVSSLVGRVDELLGADGSPEPTRHTEELHWIRLQLLELRRGIGVLRSTLTDFQHPRRHRQVGPNPRGELVAQRDRLLQIDAEADRQLERVGTALDELSQPAPIADLESPEMIEAATTLGEQRLHRVTLAHAITAFIGGMAVSFGAVAMAWTAGPWMESLGPVRAHWLGALTFPIGFVILIVGKGELFTENFLLPVMGVWKGRGTLGHLLTLWTSTLIFNLVGGLLFAFLATRDQIFGSDAASFLVHLAEEKTGLQFWPSFLRAVFAGWLMTVLTWLLLGSRGNTARLIIIWAIGFLIVAGHFNHVVISAVEIFMGIFLGADITFSRWFTANFIPALVGNFVGGVVFVTVASYLQAQSLRLGEPRVREGAPTVPTVSPERRASTH